MSFRTAVRRIVTETFPWLERIGFTAAKDLEIKSATGKIELAGGDSPVHRVGDLGTAGVFTSPAPGQLTWTGPDGSIWNVTLTSATPGSPVVIALIPVIGDVGKLVTQATSGSSKVKSG
jgi:hypothetical protein